MVAPRCAGFQYQKFKWGTDRLRQMLARSIDVDGPCRAVDAREDGRVRPLRRGELLPLMAVVVIAFLGIVLALPVLPLQVHDDPGLGTVGVGLVAYRARDARRSFAPEHGQK